MAVFNDQMAARHMRLCAPSITILAIWVLIHMIVTVRSVCLSDALSFYHGDKACGFKKTDFAKVFIDSNERCSIDCSVDSQPSYEFMFIPWEYKLANMKIQFLSTTHQRSVFLSKWCFPSLFTTSTKIYITCKQQERQNKRCDDDTQCADMTHFICNKTNRLCQCETGYYHLWETNTCVTARGIGELCSNSIQCEAKTPYSTCETDKRCRCEQGYLELNKSCSPGRQLNESCHDSIQCSAINPNATCGKKSGACECTEGLLAISNRCINDRPLGEQCEDHIQCNAATQHSMCYENKECRCQQGYIEVNDSCVPLRRLNESCDAPIQCSTPNSTCNNKTGVCECIEGYLEISNTCLSVQILLKEICKNYENSSHSAGGCEQNEIKTVCIDNTDTPLRHQEKDELYESEKNDNSDLVIGIGTACFLLGAAISGLVYFIITRNIRKTKLRSKIPSNDATEQLSVQVSQHMNSRHVYNDDIRNNEEGNDVYIHLHQDPFEVDVQSDYDHAPQQMTAEDDYSHMNTCNKTLVQEPDDYGELN